MPRKPTFLCIGAQKTGTSWLYERLSRHSAIWMTKDRNEVHYFDREILCRPLSWYEELFHDELGLSQSAGEKTPAYCHLKRQSIAFIRDYLGPVKIILILRRPDERAWSHARMNISGQNVRGLTQRDLRRCIYHLGLLFNIKRTRYDRILENWRQFFRSESMLVLFNDDIDKDPNGVLERVTRFLGISNGCEGNEQTTKNARVWESPALQMPDAVRWYLQRRYRQMVVRLAKEFPTTVDSWLSPDPCDMKVSMWDKIYVRLIADIATIPNNIWHRCSELISDVRMWRRLKGLRCELRTKPENTTSLPVARC